MGNLHIVTGYKGENHVTAADVASFQASIFGTGEYVLNRGNKFSTTVVSNNQIRVADGDILMQGRHIRMNEGTYVDLTIENGSQGYFRNDLIVARYTKDSTTGVEDCNLVVIKGTAVSADPVDPEYTTGDIIEEHVLLNDMPLYRIPLDGLNVGTLVPLFETKNGVDVTPSGIGAIPAAEKGVANGVATLDSNGKVTAQQACSTVVRINDVASYEVSGNDMGKTLLITTSGSVASTTITIPADLPGGSEFEVYKGNASLSVTFEPGENVTLRTREANNVSSLSISENYGVVAFKQLLSNIWSAVGDVE